MPDTTDSRASTPRSPFAKNRDLYLSCACTVIEGLFGGANFALIWLVMRQVFSGALDAAGEGAGENPDVKEGLHA